MFVDGNDYSCFGYVNGKLYLGRGHHMIIMQALLANGMSWEELMAAEQTWGWIVGERGGKILFRLTTDAASIDTSLAGEVAEAMTQVSGIPAEWNTVEWQSNED